MLNSDIDIKQLLPQGATLQSGKYRVVRYLSSGNFGNTYIVENTGMHVQFAMKEFFLRNICYRTGGGSAVSISPAVDPGKVTIQREKFQKEAQRLYGLKSPHLVHVHDMFEENGTVYYVMDFVKGESLSNYMQRTGRPLSEEQTLFILNQLLEGLDEVHSKQIWHLDLKPDNIMIDKDGNVVIIDFGASKQVGQSGKYTGTTNILCYTPGYAPTEQVNQNLDAIGPWTDIYALGATLYNLLTGIDPVTVSPATLQFPPSVSKKTQQLIRGMMTAERTQRPQSIAEIRQQLSSSATSSSGSSHKKLAIAAAVIGIIAIGIALLFALRGENPEQPPSSSSATSQTFIVSGVTFKMIHVEGGTFQMGSNDSEANDDEKPVHSVTLSDYYIGETEVTQELWEAVMGTTVSQQRDKADKSWSLSGVGSSYPMYYVSWNECQDFIRVLNRLTGKRFRLPTEAEWEYAARGGNRSTGAKYSGSDAVSNVAWYTDNSGSTTHPVKGKRPNELGIYDMSGNVWEWCQDWYGSYSSGSQTNPKGSASGSFRVVRGGGRDNDAGNCRVAIRAWSAPDFRHYGLGLRLVL